MDKQCIIEQLINIGIFKKGNRQLWELNVSELTLLLKEKDIQNKGET
ncbi:MULTISPECIES: Fur-regulated basic protein FbpA [unclassified Bacillus (in: firmicutes)]|nr:MULTISPECIES: Fur-regulated basic protein FbpA [unclassified Bacillus (in: firmicutes)]